MQNVPRANCITKRLTRGLVENGPRANPTTCLAMGLGTTPKMPRGQKWSTQRLTLGLVGIAESAKQTT